MADDRQQAPAAEAAEAVEIPEEELFEAPERGSADELLDAGAHSDLDEASKSPGAGRCRCSWRTFICIGRGCLD